MKQHKCSTDNCDRAVAYPRLGICHACYQYIHRWKARPISHIMRRKRNLRLYEARMEIIEPRVTTFRGKKAARR